MVMGTVHGMASLVVIFRTGFAVRGPTILHSWVEPARLAIMFQSSNRAIILD
jgi:hypothetical protein